MVRFIVQNRCSQLSNARDHYGHNYITSIVKDCLNYITSYRDTRCVSAVSFSKNIAETLSVEKMLNPKDIG